MQIACLPIPISSITPRNSSPSPSISSNPRRVFNLASFQNLKHSFFASSSFRKPLRTQTCFESPPVLSAMRSEEAIDDAFYMRRCVELAKRASGCTSPNPMVGCVIVKDGKIVGQGFHPKAGHPHAEVFALRDAGDLAENATAYVSLEPCNHYGRTPPCTEALIKAKVKRVVVGMVDPNPIVSSSGITRLTDAGIDVTVGVEEDLCKKMNEGFIHRMLTGKPFLALRYSMSVNGCFLDKIGEGASDAGGYYSKLLQEYDAIILSSSLSDKLSSIYSQEEANVSIQPIQIIVASSNAQQSPILASSNMVEESGPKVVVFTKKDMVAESGTSSSGVETVVLENINLDSILDYCYLLTGSCVLLDLSNNQFEGNLTRWSKWENVEYLDLSQNRFTGSFPDVTPQLLRANHLNLSYNKLTGSLPERIPTHYPKLGVLDISSNSLDGPLPSTLLSMPTLEEIHLQNNGMTGSIGPLPSSPGSRIRLLDLSHNRFDGDLPSAFGSLTSLQVLNLAANNLSGSLPNSMDKMVSLSSLDVSQNHFTGPLPSNLSSSLVAFNVSYNDLSGTVPENLKSFPPLSFYPGNSMLILPAGSTSESEVSKGKSMNLLIKVVIIVSCAIALIILILVAILLFCICKSRRREERSIIAGKDTNRRDQTVPSGSGGGGGTVVSAEDLVASRKDSSSGILSPDEKLAVVATGFSPSKTSNLSWSPGSGDSLPPDQQLARLDVRSPDRLVGELQFLDESIKLTPEELSRAPAEVLGRSSHGTSYRATLDNGVFLTVKWLREGVAKQRKEFAKEVKKFTNIRHPNVVTLRGYYWGPTQHEKLILSDYVSPGSLASFLYDRPGRKGPPLAWIQRLKIAVDVARGLNYLHFDRAVPHGNLKATNILLEGEELNARVSDYCLHRLMTQAGTVEQILDAGILGYRAPELAASRKPLPSFKADVYAFGVILLEILTGRCAGDVITGEQEGVDLTDWVRLRVAEGRGAECFDSVLTQEMGSDPVTEKGSKEVLGVALRCIRPVSERPGIKTIYEDLSSI